MGKTVAERSEDLKAHTKQQFSAESFKNALKPAALRAYYAEFIGMAIFLCVSVGSAVCSFKVVSIYSEIFLQGAGFKATAKDDSVSGFTAVGDNSMTMVISFAFGITIMVLAYSLGHVSGGHFNPAVTFACLIFGQIGPLQAICYMVSQCLGSIVGVFIIKGLMWAPYTNGMSYGLTTPAPGVQDWQAVLMEIFGTALLTYVVFGVAVDKHATRTVSHMAPLAIGFTVFICHMMLVPVDGCGINPARCLASAIAANYYGKLWIYWVGPMIGGPLGAAIHFIPLQVFNDDDEEDTEAAGPAKDDMHDLDADGGVEMTSESPKGDLGDKK